MRPILFDLPMPLTTPRLLIRPPQPGDGPLANAAVVESLGNLAPWMPWAAKAPSVEDSEEFARNSHARWLLREDLGLAMFDRATGLWAGGTGFHRISWAARRFEIGYWLRDRFTGEGYMTEAVTALTRYAFDVLKAARVEIRCDADNRRSAAVAERAGYVLEARLARDELKVDQKSARDTLVFRRLDGEGLRDLEVSW